MCHVRSESAASWPSSGLGGASRVQGPPFERASGQESVAFCRSRWPLCSVVVVLVRPDLSRWWSQRAGEHPFSRACVEKKRRVCGRRRFCLEWCNADVLRC
jgi:hypothetical protein